MHGMRRVAAAVERSAGAEIKIISARDIIGINAIIVEERDKVQSPRRRRVGSQRQPISPPLTTTSATFPDSSLNRYGALRMRELKIKVGVDFGIKTDAQNFFY